MPCARVPTSAHATLIAAPPSVMLFGRALRGRRKSEPSAVMLLNDTGRQTDFGAEDRPRGSRPISCRTPCSSLQRLESQSIFHRPSSCSDLTLVIPAVLPCGGVGVGAGASPTFLEEEGCR